MALPCKTALKVHFTLPHADMAVLISKTVQSHSLPPVNHCYLHRNLQQDGLHTHTHTHLYAITSTIDASMNGLTGGLNGLIMPIVWHIKLCACVWWGGALKSKKICNTVYITLTQTTPMPASAMTGHVYVSTI